MIVVPPMDQIFMLLDTVQSDNKNENDKLMNDSDTEFIAPEEIELTGNPENASFLAPEANDHVVDKRTSHTKELEAKKKKKRQKKIHQSHGNAMLLHILERIVFFRAEFPTNLMKVL